jgi:hypothetical protein
MGDKTIAMETNGRNRRVHHCEIRERKHASRYRTDQVHVFASDNASNFSDAGTITAGKAIADALP